MTGTWRNLEKGNLVKKHIRKLCINGKIITDPHCILKEQERFYRELYKSSINSPNIGEKISSFLNDLNIPLLSEEEKKSCEGSISSEECSGLLDSFQSNKTPGNDGIPAEFYRKFWPLISESFIGCANECFEKRGNVMLTKTGCNYSAREKRKRSLSPRKLAANISC